MLLPRAQSAFLNVGANASSSATATAAVVGEAMLTQSVVPRARAAGGLSTTAMTKLRLFGECSGGGLRRSKDGVDSSSTVIERDRAVVELLSRLDACKRLRERLVELERYCVAVEMQTVTSKRPDLAEFETAATFDRLLSYIRKHIDKEFPSALFHSLQDWRLENLLQLREYLKIHPMLWEWSWSHRVINNYWLELMKKLLLPTHRLELALAIAHDLPFDPDKPPHLRIQNPVDAFYQQSSPSPRGLGTRHSSTPVGSLDSLLHRVINQELLKHGVTTMGEDEDETTELAHRFDTVRVSPKRGTSKGIGEALVSQLELVDQLQQLDLAMSPSDLLNLLQQHNNDANACKAALRHLRKARVIKRAVSVIDDVWAKTEQSLVEQLHRARVLYRSLEDEESLLPLEVLGNYVRRHYSSSFNLGIISFLKNITLPLFSDSPLSPLSSPSRSASGFHLASLRDFRVYIAQQPTLWSWQCWFDFGSPEDRMVWFAVLQELLREDRRGDLLLALKHDIPLDLNASPVVQCVD